MVAAQRSGLYLHLLEQGLSSFLLLGCRLFVLGAFFSPFSSPVPGDRVVCLSVPLFTWAPVMCWAPPGSRAVLALPCPEDGQASRVRPELLGGRGTRLQVQDLLVKQDLGSNPPSKNLKQ